MRLQLALNVSALDEAIDFYTRMFGVEPAKTKPGYANFAIADPPLKLVLFEGEGDGSEGLSGMYDPFRNPRATRDALPLPDRREATAFLAAVRSVVLDRLGRLNLDSVSPLLRDGFVFRMVLQHEYQHDETILQTLQLKQGEPFRAPRGAATFPARLDIAPGAMVRFPGGEVEIGTDDRSAAYDNERPRHRLDIAPFDIDVAPVTNAAYLRFIEDGGYEREEHWT